LNDYFRLDSTQEFLNEQYRKSVQLKMISQDGKMRTTECFNLDGIFEIMLDVRSKKARPF